MKPLSRELPHSLEAEEYLLSACLIDGSETIAAALAGKVSAASFFSPANSIIYQRLCELYVLHGSVDAAMLAEELMRVGQLDAVGGFAYVAQVSGRLPTTAQACYFIDRVRGLERMRDLIRFAGNAVECAFEGEADVEQFIADFEVKVDSLKNGERADEGLRNLTEFALPEEDDPSSLLGRNRYICRGDQALIVSSAGMGKSSMALEWAVCCALGRPFHGIETKKPLTSLIIQAEDSDGDIGEVWFSIRHSLNLTAAEQVIVEQRVIIIRDKVSRGDAFVARLRLLIEKVKPDLVWLNPLHAYAGCDIADAKEMGNFLRAGLNRANKHEAFAYMVVHHTPKPMTSKGVVDKKWHEFMYDAAGSAELVNWARAVLTLKPTETEGDFNLILAKRGKRAGVMQEVTDDDNNTRLELTTKIPLRHSSESIHIEGRKHPFHLIKWMSRDLDVPEEKIMAALKYPNGLLLAYLPASNDEPCTFTLVYGRVRNGCGMAKSSFVDRLNRLFFEGLIHKTSGKQYQRTLRGDAVVKNFQVGGVKLLAS
jgi:hypothetical protein